MYFLKYSRDKEEENGQAFLGINTFISQLSSLISQLSILNSPNRAFNAQLVEACRCATWTPSISCWAFMLSISCWVCRSMSRCSTYTKLSSTCTIFFCLLTCPKHTAVLNKNIAQLNASLLLAVLSSAWLVILSPHFMILRFIP